MVTAPAVAFLTELEAVTREFGLDVLHRSEDSLQVSDPAGRLLTAFSNAEPDWEWNEAVLDETEEVVRLDCMSGYSLECRWEDLFCDVVDALASRTGVTTWVVDGDGVLWRGGSLDPAKVRL